MIAGLVFLGILASIAYFVYGYRGLSGGKAALLCASNVLGMLVMVVLLSYGLFHIPSFLWRYPDNKYQLFKELERAEQVYKNYREALIDFHCQAAIAKNLAEKYADVSNQHFFDRLLAELPQTDLEGQAIYKSEHLHMVVKKN